MVPSETGLQSSIPRLWTAPEWTLQMSPNQNHTQWTGTVIQRHCSVKRLNYVISLRPILPTGSSLSWTVETVICHLVALLIDPTQTALFAVKLFQKWILVTLFGLWVMWPTELMSHGMQTQLLSKLILMAMANSSDNKRLHTRSDQQRLVLHAMLSLNTTGLGIVNTVQEPMECE